MTLYAKDHRTKGNISRLTENVCMCAIHFLRCVILQLTSITTSFPDIPTIRSMYTYCNDDLRKSSRVVCLKRRVICSLNLHNARCKITLIPLNHSESFNINIISKASLFYLNLLLNPVNCML